MGITNVEAVVLVENILVTWFFLFLLLVLSVDSETCQWWAFHPGYIKDCNCCVEHYCYMVLLFLRLRLTSESSVILPW
jgi:hypothetical protein